MAEPYIPEKIEKEILDYWEKNKIYSRLKDRNKKGKIFYYLDGPPYTSGRIHIGHAWGKALRDSILRYKRANGFKTWDQPGFDMHGLPIEVKVEKKLHIKDKTQIMKDIGLKTFIEECKEFAVEQMKPMIKDFEKIGIWMDFENPYMTIKNEYIEGVWWALKEAEKNGYLYEGLKSMTWCPRCATALAKHELEYENVHEKSIFVKFPIEHKEAEDAKKNNKEYLVVWTTTPWTIPFNMAVMVNPELDYVKAKILDSDETWILAKALAGVVIQAVAGKKFEITDEFKGEKLKGLHYRHPFYNEIEFHQETKKDNKNAYRVVLSEEYVDTSAGSGLVHCAPGCGPEDFEVGKRNNLPVFNNIDEEGVFPKEMGVFAGLKAKKDDRKFIEALEEKGLLIAMTDVEHEYAHCWRCKSPVIFRATEQWFLAVEKLKEEMIEKNKKIYWVPDWAGDRWFDSWLNNLQDWCISRQRFWGIPLPIWKCDSCKKVKVLGSKHEVEELSGKKTDDLHRPWIDEIKFKCSCGGDMKRVEDVLDVWLDSGAASWAPLGYPGNKELFDELWPADFILEGKDQIRGWFNSMMCLSMVSFKKIPYKAVYMHGFTNDALGRKMSKSLGNIISPYEVVDKYGADTLRYYLIGAAKPGLDINYNFEDAKLKSKNLMILWNVHNYVIDLCRTNSIKPKKIRDESLDIEEKYIISKLHSTILEVTELFDSYKLNEIPWIIEALYLELSRTYMQLVREKSSVGSKEDKELIASTIYEVLYELLRLLTPIAPFICEKIYLDLKKEFELKEDSVSFEIWPKADKRRINKKLEEQFEVIEPIIQNILSEREKSQLGVRWPLAKVEMTVKTEEEKEAIEALKEIIMTQTNVKNVLATIGEPKIELDTNLTPQLEAEGFAREVSRRIQALRKTAGLKKDDNIHLHIKCSDKLKVCLEEFDDYIKEKCGASELNVCCESPKEKHHHEKKEKVKEEEFEIHFNKK